MKPLVSVIIPVRNGAATVGEVLDALAAQEWPTDRMQVIVADNGSTDGTGEVARARGATVVVEDQVFSAAAARNRGIDAAEGDILLFVDCDCVMEPGWVSALVAALEGENADLAGGAVRSRLGRRPLLGHYEDLSYARQEARIREHGVSGTGNLAVRRTVFDAVGPFRADLRQGEDDEFCQRVVAAGFVIAFAPGAVVYRAPVESVAALLRRQYRSGRTEVALLAAGGQLVRAPGSSYLSRKRAYVARVLRAQGVPWFHRIGVIVLNLAASVAQWLGRRSGGNR